MSGSADIFDFLNDVWDLLPEEDRLRFGELWKAYEQTYGDVWMKLLESGLASNIDTIPLHNNIRWLKHTFDESTSVDRVVTYRGNQDLSKGLNLSVRYLFRFAVNEGDSVEVDLRGSNPSLTRNVEIVEKINQAAGFKFATLEESGALLRLKSNVAGENSTIEFLPASDPDADAIGLILGVNTDDLPILLPDFRYAYQLQDRLLTHIPVLQDRIHDDQVTYELKENEDFTIEMGSGVISFREPPPVSEFWAKDNLFNYETPYNNFGYLLDLYDRNTEAYLKAIKGLWFAFWTGPRPENIRRSIYLLFGLPTASGSGTVTGLTTTEITLTYDNGKTETFQIPSELTPEVELGDTVSRFQPLVSGINVYDKVNSPGFLAREVGVAGVYPFLTEKASLGYDPSTDEQRALKLVEQNTYLPQIDVNAFISQDIRLSNVKTFLKNIQPKSRTFLFQVLVGKFSDPISLSEHLGQDVSFDVTPNLDSNPWNTASQDLRDSGEDTLDSGLQLDSDGFTLWESLDIEVNYGGGVPLYLLDEGNFTSPSNDVSVDEGSFTDLFTGVALDSGAF